MSWTPEAFRSKLGVHLHSITMLRVFFEENWKTPPTSSNIFSHWVLLRCHKRYQQLSQWKVLHGQLHCSRVLLTFSKALFPLWILLHTTLLEVRKLSAILWHEKNYVCSSSKKPIKATKKNILIFLSDCKKSRPSFMANVFSSKLPNNIVRHLFINLPMPREKRCIGFSQILRTFLHKHLFPRIKWIKNHP